MKLRFPILSTVSVYPLISRVSIPSSMSPSSNRTMPILTFILFLNLSPLTSPTTYLHLSLNPSSIVGAPADASSTSSIGGVYRPKKTHGSPSPTSRLPPLSVSSSNAGIVATLALLAPRIFYSIY